jgi:heat shock protein HslJ
MGLLRSKIEYESHGKADCQQMKQRPCCTLMTGFLLAFVVSVNVTAADSRDNSEHSVNQLIDDLTQIESQAPGTGGPQGAQAADIEGHQWHIGHSLIDVVDASHKWRGDAGKGKPNITFASGAIEGSPGCGRFNGAYRRSGEELTIAAGWTDDKEKPCNDKEKESATNILRVLTNVRKTHHGHWENWHLDDEEGRTQVSLSPMQPGIDLSELEDTFGHLTRLGGSRARFADVIVNIGPGLVTFSRPPYQTYFIFKYKLGRLEFPPDDRYEKAAKDRELSQDEQTAQAFEKVLREIGSYEAGPNSVTFFDKDRQPIMVINSFPRTTIENHRWRIAKYRGDSSPSVIVFDRVLPITQQADKDGLLDANDYAEVTFMNGHVTGSPGCGGWWGTYKLSGNQLTFDATLSLFGTCPDEDFVQDRLVENAFRAAVLVEQKGDHVLLRDKYGKVQILLVPY